MTWHYNAFAMSYGVKSAVVKYSVTAYADNHRCFAVDPDVGYQHEFAAAKDGETVSFSLPDSWYDREEYESAYIADVKPFIYYREDTKVDVTNKVDISIDPEGSYFTCTLPEADGDDLPFGYNLYFDISFAKDIEKAAVNIALRLRPERRRQEGQGGREVGPPARAAADGCAGARSAPLRARGCHR